MKLEEKIVSDLAFNLKQSLVKKIIKELKNKPLLFCVDEIECLESLWEEYCVSVQDKHSKFSSDEYKENIIELFENSFKTLDLYERVAIWVSSPDGIDWIYDKKEKSCELENVPYSFQDCKEIFYTLIYNVAKEYDNDNIYRCIYMGCGKFKEDYSEDDKEQVYE